MSQGIKKEVRFKFGKNWNNYLDNLNDFQINYSIQSLSNMLPNIDPVGKSFLDVGCGSGLSSLSATKLGFKVTSFDYDKVSVKTTKNSWSNVRDLLVPETSEAAPIPNP